MTDTLVDLNDDMFLSPNESMPTPAEPLTSTEKRVCPECGATKSKTGIAFLSDKQLATHRNRSHGWTPAPGEAKADQKRVNKPRTKTTTSSTRLRTARRPLGESLARIILQVGRIVNAVEPPTGAAIMFEAGALGVALDNVIAGTIIDKPLQKGAAVAEKFEPLVPLVTLPAMIFMLSHNPAMNEMLEGEIREALEDVLVQSLPLLKRRAARTRATTDALAEIGAIDPALAESKDPIGDILRGFFTGPITEQTDD